MWTKKEDEYKRFIQNTERGTEPKEIREIQRYEGREAKMKRNMRKRKM